MAESEHVNKQPTFVRVRGKVARTVLLLFLTAPPESIFTTVQISRKLKLDYNAVWSALRRLRAGSLITRVTQGFTLAKNRRVVAQAAYDAEGKPVPKDEEICSLSLAMVPQVGTSAGHIDSEKVSGGPKENEIDIGVGLKKHPMDEGMDRRAAWLENAIVRTRIDLYIVGILRAYCKRIAGRGSRSHQASYSCEQFTITFTHKGHVTLWPKRPDSRISLDKWLVDARLDDDNRRLFWSSIDRAWPQTKATLETPLKLHGEDDLDWFFHEHQDASLRSATKSRPQPLQEGQGVEARSNLRWLGNFWATMAGTVANVLPLKELLDEHVKSEQTTIESLSKRVQLLEDILARFFSQGSQQSKEGSKSGYDSYV